jgi:PAS domain S-box-containing protein
MLIPYQFAYLFIGTFIGSLFLLIVLSIIISESITRPIRDMTKVARLIEKGNLDARVFVTSGDEIQDLGSSFNSMAKELKEKLLELQEKIALLQTQKISLNHSTELLQSSEINLKEINKRLEKEREIIAGEKNKLSVILSGIKDAVIAVDLSERIILFNESARDLLGYDVAEVLGKPLSSCISLYYKETLVKPEIYCPIRHDSYEGVMYHENMIKIIGKNNKEVYGNIVTGKIKDSERNNLGCILTLHDITSERDLEEMKLDFVSMAAHELRTPLTAIQGYLSVFIDENPDVLVGEKGNLLQHVKTSTNQLMGLVENLLSVSRIERNAFTLNRTSLDWVGLVDEVMTDFIFRAKEKNITLSFVRPGKKISEVIADKIRIREVLSNLIANALSYTPSGGQILITIDEDETFVNTHIKDTGVGIPQTALSRLFSKFFRVSNSLSQGSKGTGLGLYISKAIVEMHKGKIWVDSEVNKGSTFSFSIPKFAKQTI